MRVRGGAAKAGSAGSGTVMVVTVLFLRVTNSNEISYLEAEDYIDEKGEAGNGRTFKVGSRRTYFPSTVIYPTNHREAEKP